LQVVRLRYTPRKFVVHPESNMLVVAEADHASMPLAERKAAESGMDADSVDPLTDVRALRASLLSAILLHICCCLFLAWALSVE
jgi:hypothetical protein